jgi:hypothetical protein
MGELSETVKRWQCPACGGRFTVPIGWDRTACADCLGRGERTVPAEPASFTFSDPPETVRARRVRGMRSWPWVALVSGLAIAAGLLFRPAPPLEERIAARVHAIVRERLVSPKTAEFADSPEVRIRGDRFWLSSWVDSQNRLGVPLRETIHAEGTFADKIAVEQILLGDETLFTTAARRAEAEALAAELRAIERQRPVIVARTTRVLRNYFGNGRFRVSFGASPDLFVALGGKQQEYWQAEGTVTVGNLVRPVVMRFSRDEDPRLLSLSFDGQAVERPEQYDR